MQVPPILNRNNYAPKYPYSMRKQKLTNGIAKSGKFPLKGSVKFSYSHYSQKQNKYLNLETALPAQSGVEQCQDQMD